MMMNEPIYECQRCGRDLEKNEIGKVTWCAACQWTWTDGFDEGVKQYKELMDTGDVLSVIRKMHDFMPWVVKG